MRYVAITYRGHYFMVVQDGYVSIQGTGVGPDTIFERIELGDDQVAFRTLDGRHLTAFTHDIHPAGALRVDAGERGPAQTFLEVWLPDDRIGLRTHLGTFICAEGNGDSLVINRRQLGEWEKFFYQKPPDELVPKQKERADVRTSVQDSPTTMDRPAASRDLRTDIFRPLGR